MPRDPRIGAGEEGGPVKAPDERLAHLTKDAWRGFVRALQATLAEHGVSFGHWTFLRILWQRDGLTQRELSEEAGVMEPSTYAAIRAMEELGYVSRSRMPGNRKNVYVRLAPKGRALERKLVPLAEEVNALAALGLKKSEVEMTRRCLLAVIENLNRSSSPSPSRSARISRRPRGS